ncbi:MAG: pyridoxal phosphate-dependent aminotransferase, partial [Myxococcales bacterium]|nr:pyridoxal phosphate-dependent aminotransferase [Myxococcales bacterium]
GDTWMEPAAGCRMEDIKVADNPGMHRYAPVAGLPSLLEAIAARVEARTGVATEPANLLVSAGATGALAAAAAAIVSPGDEVLILAPYWPLIAGIVRQAHGVPVPVPVFAGEVSDADAAVAACEARLSDRTVALYLNTPNNPTGRLLPAAWVEALVAWGRARDLWIFADEVYEDYVYRGEHTYTRPLAPERTFAAHSFSKAYGMAGNRCGYLIGPQEAIDSARKIAAHTFYSTPTAAQLAAVRVLGEVGDAWIADARRRYQELGDEAAARLGVAPPEGSTFLFLDVADHLDARGLQGLLEDCADRGLLIAPGTSFGPYPTHVRLCFTSAPPEQVRRGVAVLAELLGR